MKLFERMAAATPQRFAFEAADEAWSIELRRVFGKRARDARYRPEGKGKPGSELRRIYDARDVARVAYDKAMDAPRECIKYTAPHKPIRVIRTWHAVDTEVLYGHGTGWPSLSTFHIYRAED